MNKTSIILFFQNVISLLSLPSGKVAAEPLGREYSPRPLLLPLSLAITVSVANMVPVAIPLVIRVRPTLVGSSQL